MCSNNQSPLEQLSQENKETLVLQTELQDQRMRYDDKKEVTASISKHYAIYTATITTFISAAVTGSSLTVLLGGRSTWQSIVALVLLWLALLTLLWELLASMHYAKRYADHLALNDGRAPDAPSGNLLIFILQIATTILFLQGLLFLGISWLV